MIIDAHVHLYPPEVGLDAETWALGTGESHWAVLCTRRRRDGRPVQTLPTVDELLRTMDAAGVGQAVLLGWYWERAETCAWQNRFYAECVRTHPDRLMAFATVHPAAGREETLAEVRRARDAGLVGLGELSPHSQHYALDDWVFADVLALAGELGLPVNLHVTDPAGRPYPGRVATPLADFTGLARAFPQTKFILAHWGGLLPLVDATATAAALPNVWYDTAATPLLYEPDIWGRALPVYGADRVIFGSDFPLNLYPQPDQTPGLTRLVAEVRKAGVPEAVLSANLLSLLSPSALPGRNEGP